LLLIHLLYKEDLPTAKNLSWAKFLSFSSFCCDPLNLTEDVLLVCS